MVQHPSSNVVDPQYITVTNTTSYRYYAFKFADTWGGNYMNVRRIELQTAETDYRKNIILDDGVKLTSGRIPVATTNGRLFDFNTFKYISGSGVELTGSINATSFSGSFSGSFYGNGSGLTNISAGSLPSGLLSGSAQIATEISGAFTVVSSSYSTRVTSLETKQSYSGSFSGSFSGNGSGLTNIVSASYAATASYALNSTALPSGLLSGSAQIAVDISGAFTSVSSSITSRVANLENGSFGISLDGGGGVISTGQKGYFTVNYPGSISRWDIFADTTGSITIDVWKTTYANYPPTVANTIAGSEKPFISASIKNQDTSLSSFTSSFTAYDVFGYNVDSCTTITRANLIFSTVKV